MRIRDVMTHAPTTCEPNTSVRLAAQLMADHNCAAIPVTRSGRLVGIVTDRDIACRSVAAGRSTDGPAGDVMSSPVITVNEDDPVETAVALMEGNRVHHLPVLDAGGKLCGIVARSDLGRRMTNREFGELSRETDIPSFAEFGHAAIVKAAGGDH